MTFTIGGITMKRYYAKPETVTPFESVCLYLYGYVEIDDNDRYSGRTTDYMTRNRPLYSRPTSGGWVKGLRPNKNVSRETMEVVKWNTTILQRVFY